MPGLEAPSHWVILALVVLVLFGYKKLPEMSRSVGRSLRIFKTEMKGMGEDDSSRDAADTHAGPPVAGTPVVPTAPVSPTAPVVPVVPPVATVVSPVPDSTQTEPAAGAPREAPQQQAQAQ
ncbi:Sec-independent protein translocase subunit TatA [Jatrophihabitans lederbergiae]|uniref:Sec-independent protein translocase protein TatA n=1 Tax=Jatrophihabitans lederbergiae TaxID=3075547 RepID=A0ABU2J7Y1_9ACTN|nr:Sec-independent protein translocase subunit TatA [Jatrophihabitans sp. DSM 44399]MDT0261095.1 Sec-independent protein translocase subunit TatA [Jatrophihabitans sp. DSM 44399]